MSDIFNPKREISKVASATYHAERRVFSRLKSDCSDDSKQEYELAIATLVERYNTTIYENRFIVGGAVEVFTYALLRSVGIDCTLYGDQAKSGDILLPNDKKLSVKGTFTGGVSDVRLLNKQGAGIRIWDTATLFVVSGIGIVYGSPDMVNPEHIKDISDAVILKRKGLKELSDNSKNVFDLEISEKPPTEMTGFSHKASTAVAKQILFEMKSTKLLKSINTS